MARPRKHPLPVSATGTDPLANALMVGLGPHMDAAAKKVIADICVLVLSQIAPERLSRPIGVVPVTTPAVPDTTTVLPATTPNTVPFATDQRAETGTALVPSKGNKPGKTGAHNGTSVPTSE